MTNNHTTTYPGNRRAAMSLSFDDARPTQVDNGFPILNAHGIKATFYVSMFNVEARLDEWRQAVSDGHEIGNHTVNHPCSGNYSFARNKALEQYDLERMAEELDGATQKLKELLGVTTTTFAYPCGQTFVGCGLHRQSYVPLVAQRFLIGRGIMSAAFVHPDYCDWAAVASESFDHRSWEWVRKLVDAVIEQGEWLIFHGHNVSTEGDLMVFPPVLEKLCDYAREREADLWTDTVAAVGKHLRQGA